MFRLELEGLFPFQDFLAENSLFSKLAA